MTPTPSTPHPISSRCLMLLLLLLLMVLRLLFLLPEIAVYAKARTKTMPLAAVDLSVSKRLSAGPSSTV